MSIYNGTAIKTVDSIALEAEWIDSLFQERTMRPDEDILSFTSFANAPVLDSMVFWNRFLRQTKVDVLERAVLGLSLLAILSPGILIKYSDGLSTMKEFASLQLHGILFLDKSNLPVPTLQTLLVLLAGTNATARRKYMHLFSPHHRFFKEDLLRMGKDEAVGSLLGRAIYPSPDLLSIVLSGEIAVPAFGPEFPAKLIETGAEWGDLVLEVGTLNKVMEVAHWIQHAERIMDGLGMRKKLRPGYRALFYGPPGTGKTFTCALLMGAGAAGIVGGGISIIDRLEHETFEWDLKTGFDIATIVTGLVVGFGGFASGFSINVGKGVMVGMGLGLDAGWGILLTEHYSREIDRIRSSDLLPAEKETQIRLIIEEAVFTGGLMILENVAGLKSLFGRKNLKVTPAETKAAEAEIAAFKSQAAQLEKELAALRAKQEKISAQLTETQKNIGKSGNLYSSVLPIPPTLVPRLAALAEYFLKRGAVGGQITFAKFKVWMQRKQISLAHHDTAVDAQLRQIWDEATAELRMTTVTELSNLRSLSRNIRSEHVPPNTEFQSNGRIFEFEVVDGMIKFKDQVWNKNGNGHGIYDFVIRENGELVIGEYHTYLLGKGNEAVFRSQGTFKGAGKMTIENGKIVHVDNNTGHLKTSKRGALNQTGILKDSGLGSPKITYDPSHAPQ